MFLSIVVPYFNCGAYVYACLDSLDKLIAKTAFSIEVIVVDDFNEPKQVNMLESVIGILKNTHHFKVVRPEQNLGLSDARNFGVSHAQGEYVFFLDSDDYINTNHLAQVLEVLRAVNTDAIYFDSHTFETEHNWRQMNQFSFEPRCVVSVNDGVVASYLKDCTFYAWRFVIKKHIAQKSPFHSRLYMEDIATTPVLLSLCQTVWYEPLSVVNYRIRPNSIMSTWNPKKFVDMVQATSFTQNALNEQYAYSSGINNELKVLGYRFFYWAIADARRGDKNKVTFLYYNQIKSLYTKNFGDFSFKDYGLLRSVFSLSQSLKWLLLYYSYTIYNRCITAHGHLKYKALRKKLYRYGILFIKCLVGLFIVCFVLANGYMLLERL